MHVVGIWKRLVRRSDWLVAACLACLSGVIGCDAEPANGADAVAPAETAVPVQVAKVQLTTLRPSVDLVGRLEAMPERTAEIAPQIEGQIKSVAAVDGAAVKSGQVLVQLDQRRSQAERVRAEAVVAQQQAALDKLIHGFLPQEIEIAKQDAQQAKVALDATRLRVDAAQVLHEKGEVSDIEFSKLQSMLEHDASAYAAAAAKLDLVAAGTRPEVLAEAQAQLDTANAELSQARLAEAFCSIPSPIDGVVIEWRARQGMQVTPADQLAVVADLSQMFVRLRVPGEYLSKFERGARVQVNVPSLPDRTFEGKIERFSGAADPVTGDVEAFVVVPNEEGLLKPGLACRARAWLPPIVDALVVPVSAVEDREGLAVLHVVRDDKAYEVEVTVGAATRELVQITKGLAADDSVITQGGYGLPDGCPVSTSEG